MRRFSLTVLGECHECHSEDLCVVDAWGLIGIACENCGSLIRLATAHEAALVNELYAADGAAERAE